MVGLTKEQRAAKAAAAEAATHADEQEQRAAKAAPQGEPPTDVLMERDGAETLVRNNASVQVMEALGWRVKA